MGLGPIKEKLLFIFVNFILIKSTISFNPQLMLKYLKSSLELLDIYAIDEFKDYVESCGITGFRFKEVFDFDDPDKEYPLM